MQDSAGTEEKVGAAVSEPRTEVPGDTLPARSGKTVSDPYPERSDAEATEGVVNIDPANPDHQAARLEHSNDYRPDNPEGYVAPDYS